LKKEAAMLMRVRAVSLLLVVLAGVIGASQTAPPGGSPPAVTLQFGPSSDQLLEGLAQELSEEFRERARELRVRLPEGTPIPGFALGIFPDGSAVAAVPSAELVGLSSRPRGELLLGMLYLSPPAGAALPRGFYKLVLAGDGRRVLLVGGSPGDGQVRTLPAQIEPSRVDASLSPSLTPSWEISPGTSAGGAQRAKVKVSVRLDKIVITIEVEW
jgi:hypothetical protein